jgi:hypothetical protein
MTRVEGGIASREGHTSITAMGGVSYDENNVVMRSLEGNIKNTEPGT